MKFKALLFAATTLSAVLFPLSAAPWGTTSVFYYYNAAGENVGLRAPRLCEVAWGVTTPYYTVEICQ